MTIEKINNNKIKIVFYIEELENNNISLHSFLSNSREYQEMFSSIIKLANEEFGFNIKNNYIISETISLNNEKFIIFVTSKNLNSLLIYDFLNYDEFIAFSKYCKKCFKTINFKNSLYKYDNRLFLYIDLSFLNLKKLDLLTYVLSEYKSNISLSSYTICLLEEHSELLVKDKAIQKFA